MIQPAFSRRGENGLVNEEVGAMKGLLATGLVLIGALGLAVVITLTSAVYLEVREAVHPRHAGSP